MRILGVSIAVLFLAGVATAQAPAAQPHANLAQLMRGVFFPNANILFDVQSQDPAEFGKKKEGQGPGATSDFGSIYTGWQVVENAALALAEASSLLAVKGRICQNKRPVPIEREDWAKYTREMQAAALAMVKAAQSENRELASDTTNDVAGACENCHVAYRDKEGGGPRCVP